MKRKLFIYVGAHKTGSTFLHRELLKLTSELGANDCRYDHDAVRYAKTLLARGYPIDPLTIEKLSHEIHLTHAAWKEKNIILISEHFMGNPFSGYLDVESIARALPAVFPESDIHIILSVRRQDHFVESWYNQSIKEGGFWTFADFMEKMVYQNLDWNRIAATYETIFGRDKVRVVAYEEMYKEPAAIIDAHFKGWAYDGSITPQNQEPVNPSVSPKVIELLRQSNRLLGPTAKTELRKILETCAPKAPGQDFELLQASQRTALLTSFRDSNTALAQRYPESGVHRYLEAGPFIDQPAPPAPQANVIDAPSLQVLQLVFKHHQTRTAELTETITALKQSASRQKAKHDKFTQKIAAELRSVAKKWPAALVSGELRDISRQLCEAGLKKKKEPALPDAPSATLPSSAPSAAPSAASPAPLPPPTQRPSNPALDWAHPALKAQAKEWKKLPPGERDERLRASRREVYLQSGESDRVQRLKNIHKGKRCFILGNGPSLKSQDLSLLKGEITFVSNWFVNADDYHVVNPTYYCVSSHEMFGGWNKPDPKLNEDYYAKMQERAKASTKVFSFAFHDYLKSAGLFPDEKVYSLLFERPKQLVDEAGHVNFDLTRHLLDGYTVIQTMCIPLAAHFGCTEIILLGCDCDYGIQNASDPKKYFYDTALHKTATSKFESLQRIWADNGPVFRSYEICRDKLAERGITLKNATAGGRLNVLPRISYESLFQ